MELVRYGFVSKQEAMFSLLTEDTMMCSKTVTCNESKLIVINSIKGPESIGLLHPCKSHLSSPILINNVVCSLQSAVHCLSNTLFISVKVY